MLSREELAEPQLATRPAASGAVMVLGMHRSGTSFLTGSLQLAGLDLGKHSTWNRHNRQGNRENPDIMAFHDMVLARRGAAWDNPPPEPVVWTTAESREAAAILACYDADRWGFKDPRALLMTAAWESMLPSVAFIGIFRTPAAVAASLAARGRMQFPRALELWADYNTRLLALHRRRTFPLLCFDDPEPVLHQRLDRALHAVGLEPLGDRRFFTAELKHHGNPPAPLPPAIDRLYRELRARSC